MTLAAAWGPMRRASSTLTPKLEAPSSQTAAGSSRGERERRLWGAASLIVVALTSASGCTEVFDLDRFHIEDPAPTLPLDCVPANTSTPVADDCGVFVSSSQGDDANAGTRKAEAFATIAKALGAAKGKPVYLCGETFAGAVEIGGGALVYGGLDCADGWKYAGATKPSVITAGPDEIPLRVGANNSVELYDVTIRAADAVKKGGSSIALLAEGKADVMLSRATVEAGNGANGEDGEAFVEAAMAGSDGLPGKDACSANFVEPGLSVKNTCAEGESISGAGGIGQEASGGPGE